MNPAKAGRDLRQEEGSQGEMEAEAKGCHLQPRDAGAPEPEEAGSTAHPAHTSNLVFTRAVFAPQVTGHFFPSSACFQLPPM